jgi:hypothetical protein
MKTFHHKASPSSNESETRCLKQVETNEGLLRQELDQARQLTCPAEDSVGHLTLTHPQRWD